MKIKSEKLLVSKKNRKLLEIKWKKKKNIRKVFEKQKKTRGEKFLSFIIYLNCKNVFIEVIHAPLPTF